MPSPRTAAGCDKVAPVHYLALLADPAADVRIIKGMLLVGLLFIAVIALGETSNWLRHRRR
jgi:hypothetical protein